MDVCVFDRLDRRKLYVEGSKQPFDGRIILRRRTRFDRRGFSFALFKIHTKRSDARLDPLRGWWTSPPSVFGQERESSQRCSLNSRRIDNDVDLGDQISLVVPSLAYRSLSSSDTNNSNVIPDSIFRYVDRVPRRNIEGSSPRFTKVSGHLSRFSLSAADPSTRKERSAKDMRVTRLLHS